MADKKSDAPDTVKMTAGRAGFSSKKHEGDVAPNAEFETSPERAKVLEDRALASPSK